ncbi:DNA repair ATPase [Frankia sp. Cpl3]|nr:DNA repair ATPase [Frankia sp. Cpl3]
MAPVPTERSATERDSYEVLRARLAEQATELTRRADTLNAHRLAVFGGIGLRLLGTEQVSTRHPCVPQDIVALGEHLLLGCNMPTALPAGSTPDGEEPAAVTDALSLHRLVRAAAGGAAGAAGSRFRFDGVGPDGSAGPDADAGSDVGSDVDAGPGGDVLPGVLHDPTLHRDFRELYRYYRDTRLLRLRRLDDRMLAVFQTGRRPEDIRVLRWRTGTRGTADYLDNLGERDHVLPPAHDLDWIAASRDDHVLGRHPHVSVQGAVFVSTVGGTLTVKTENDTESADGIYREPVDEPLQSLADAEIQHARVGPLVLLRIRPYKEAGWRYLVFNTRNDRVVRLDGIGRGCRRLPAEQGIIFADGYHLTTGTVRAFGTDSSDLEFDRVIHAPGGEDVLYVFHARTTGRFLLLPYNLIRQDVATPLACHGYALFGDGTLVLLRTPPAAPARTHAVQIWQTPYGHTAESATVTGSGPLERIGNADLVQGISDCISVARLVAEMTPSHAVLEALIGACGRAFDRYHWLGDADLADLGAPLAEVRATAERVLEEFETVQALTEAARATLADAAAEVDTLLRRVRDETPQTAGAAVTALADLRRAQGRLVALRDVRHIDLARIDVHAAELDAGITAAGRRAVEFLQGDDAFADYRAETDQLAARAAAIGSAAAAAPIAERLAEQNAGLETVVEIVTGLDIVDTAARTHLLDRIGEVFAEANRARAILDARRGQLFDIESRAVFAAEFALLGQAVTAALAIADTPERCDEQLGRLLVSLERLESRFGDSDDASTELAARRADLYDTFSARRQELVQARTRRSGRRADSADRILASIRRRCVDLRSLDEINTYFATDPMVTTLHGIVTELRSLGEQIRADEIAGRVEAARLDARRALRDRADLYEDDALIRLGRHLFTVNTQPVDLALVPDGDHLVFVVTGTDYRRPVRAASFAQTRPFWDQPLPSESPQVYRAEYLATRILADAVAGAGGLSVATLVEAADIGNDLLELVRRAAGSRHDEGYERGVHDRDAATILAALARSYQQAGLLRYPSAVRAAAQLFWACGTDDAGRVAWGRRAASLARARAVFRPAQHAGVAQHVAPGQMAAPLNPRQDGPKQIGDLRAELAVAVAQFLTGTGTGTGRERPSALADLTALVEQFGGVDIVGEYLFEELAGEPAGFVTSAAARELHARFRRALGELGVSDSFDHDLRTFDDDLAARYQLAAAWLGAFHPASGPDAGNTADVEESAGATNAADPRDAAGGAADVPEAVAVVVCGSRLPRHDSSARLVASVDGLLGSHPRIDDGRLELRLDETLARTRRFHTERVPAYRAYRRARDELISQERERLRLDEYQATVPASFVRNRLVDEVYLPLVGANLARQLGAAGDGTHPDRMGLLLLVSPPGYGKTMLMEYVASRLGLVFVKVDGPALGGAVSSLDPAAAPDAAARREIEKIAFALELGSNVLLYLDDIQHTAPGLLEKFIPLCDTQRRMDGVWDGQTRTYDLRGKRFAVCMAGNPYTESGGRFRVPDMLANRADVWNLGDVLSGRDQLFARSYLENAVTSNPVLAPLAGREHADLELLIRMAEGDPSVRPDRLSHPYPQAELDQILAVLRKLVRVQQVVLAVNRAYIASAGQDDTTRTEPPFLLQGSYRNMNRLAERIVPVMNDEELDALLHDHYLAEAQTLTSGAEANLLRFAELRGSLTADQAARWAEVKARYQRSRETRGSPNSTGTGRPSRG